MTKQQLAIFLFLSLLVLSFSQVPPKVAQGTPNFDQNSFDKFYKQSARSDLDYKQRLELINRAYHLVTEAAIDSLLFKTLRRKAYVHKLNKQKDSALYFAKGMMKVAIRTQDSVFIGIASNRIGNYYSELQVLDSAFYYFDNAKNIFEVLGDSLQISKNCTRMAILLSDAGQYALSDELAVEALDYLKNTEAAKNKATLYNCMAINSKDQDDLQDALYWYDLAIRTTPSDENRIVYQSNVPTVYRNIGEYDKAIELYESVLEDLVDHPIQDHYYRTNNNLNYTRWLQTKDRGLEDALLQGLQSRKATGGKNGELRSLSQVTRFYLDWNQAKARLYALKYYEQAVEMQNVNHILEALQLLMKAYDRDIKTHDHYARIYMFVEDSIQKVNAQLSTSFAKIRFDSAQNRRENQNLKKVNLEKELQLAKSQQRNTIYLALGVISMISFFFIYRISRSRLQKEKLQEVFQTEARISKKVHDEVANDLYKVMNILDQKTGENDPVLDDLEQIYNKTRDISRENNDFDQQQDFGDLISDLLSNYSTDQINIITRGLNQMDWSKTDQLNKKTIYRVIQELLTNMKKHSMASVVILSFKTEKNKIHIKYSDDGKGAVLKKSNGLYNMENRIRNLGGSLTLVTEKGKGFKASIIV